MINVPSPQTVVNNQKQIAAHQDTIHELTHESFINDYAKSGQFIRMMEINILYLKHKLLPDAIKANKQEATLSMPSTTYLSTWLANDKVMKSIIMKMVLKHLQNTLSKGYTVVQDPTNEESFKISWEIGNG